MFFADSQIRQENETEKFLKIVLDSLLDYGVYTFLTALQTSDYKRERVKL